MSTDERPWKSPKTATGTRPARSDCWRNFNERTYELARAAAAIGDPTSPAGRIAAQTAFAAYIRTVEADVGRIARIAARKKSLPGAWIDVEDVMGEVRLLIWEYMFVRADETGTIGFDFAKCNSPGAWLHWKVNHNLGKTISRQRGECQHSRRGPGRPEYLSSTGELPERGEEPTAESACARSKNIEALKRVCKTAKEFAILAAIRQDFDDDRAIAAYLLEKREAPDLRTANRMVKDFVESKARTFASSTRSRYAA